MVTRGSVALVLVLAAAGAAVAAPAPLLALAAAIDRGDYPKTTSVLVVRDGRTVYERYFGAGSPELLNNTRSATKVFAALAVGAAIADGAIPSPSVPAFAYLSDLAPFQNDTPEKDSITIADLLTMSSALDCDDNDDHSPGNEDRMHEQANWTRWAVDLPTLPGYARDASGLGPWRYCTANALLAGQVVQRATHTPIDRYVEDRLLRPLGIRSWNWSYSPAREPMTGGGLELRSRDWATVAWMLVDRGRWHDHQILPERWIDAVLTVRRPAAPGQNYGYFDFEETYQTDCGAERVWYVAGNGGSQILLVPWRHAAVVITRQNYNLRGTSRGTTDMIRKYILPSLPCGRPDA